MERLLGEHGLEGGYGQEAPGVWAADGAGELESGRGGFQRLAGGEVGAGRARGRASGATAGDGTRPLAQRLVEEALAVARWREIDLALAAKGHPLKVEIARQLRDQTPMSRRWIAERLGMGSASYVSGLLARVDRL